VYYTRELKWYSVQIQESRRLIVVRVNRLLKLGVDATSGNLCAWLITVDLCVILGSEHSILRGNKVKRQKIIQSLFSFHLKFIKTCYIIQDLQ
jgi:hypothetical protein